MTSTASNLEGDWVVVLWQNGAPSEVCRRRTWTAANIERTHRAASAVGRLTIEDASSWTRYRPTPAA